MKAPEFFRQNNNKFPDSVKNAPFQLAFGTDLSYFAWLDQNPGLARDFQQWMALKQRASPNWIDWFDIQGCIIEGAEAQPSSRVLLVDVGGGEGNYVKQFQESFPNASGRLILQDLPHVISGIEKPPTNVELVSHDFFTPQPIQGIISLQTIQQTRLTGIYKVPEHISCTGFSTTGPTRIVALF